MKHAALEVGTNINRVDWKRGGVANFGRGALWREAILRGAESAPAGGARLVNTPLPVQGGRSAGSAACCQPPRRSQPLTLCFSPRLRLHTDVRRQLQRPRGEPAGSPGGRRQDGVGSLINIADTEVSLTGESLRLINGSKCER